MHFAKKTLITLIGLTVSSIVFSANSVEHSVPPPQMASELVFKPDLETRFVGCLDELKQKALAEGVSVSLIDQTFPKLKPVKKVVELDAKQPEFTETFANYFNKRVNEYRIEKGRELYLTHKVLLQKLTREYGVPAQYLLAFWGLETNFGGYLGGMPTLDSLATLACEPRRKAFFSGEFVAALQLMEQNHLDLEQLKGSWAGAVGHTQFMPTNYLKYAVDGDGDGVVNLWQSIPDALTSAANFLRALGWQKELRWGREVALPKGFAYELAGVKNTKTVAQWKQLGVRTADKGALPVVDGLNASLLVPAGHQGPAFLVYINFDVIMNWNRSESYALAVAHLADRINGAGALRFPPPTDEPRLLIEDVKQLQIKLNALGFDAGKEDGILGPSTRNAIRGFQLQQNLIADGYPATEVFEKLR